MLCLSTYFMDTPRIYQATNYPHTQHRDLRMQPTNQSNPHDPQWYLQYEIIATYYAPFLLFLFLTHSRSLTKHIFMSEMCLNVTYKTKF